MSTVGLQKGKRYEVIVYEKDAVLCAVEHVVISTNEVQTSVFVEDAQGLVTVREAISAALAALDFHMAKPAIRRMVEERIEELKAVSDEAGRDDPPAPLTDDIPF